MSIAEKYRPNYTYDDYCQWEGRWELIEGMPYAMSPAPVPEHQRAVVALTTEFEIALRKGCKKCKTYAPLDWKITENTILQPDLLILCNEINKKFLDFAPALVVEILSPSTALKDRNLKMEIYQQQQVKYYLILDPQFKKTEIYQLQQGAYKQAAENPTDFTFTLQDDCSINVNFTEVWH
jgi:Uma2 family endonuclease